MLGHLALAVIQAGAYVSKAGCSLQDYSKLYQERQKELLEEYQNNIQRADDYQSTVFTTWNISFAQLSNTAQQFMQLCACLHFDGIPAIIFQNAALKLASSGSSDIDDKLHALGSGTLRYFHTGIAKIIANDSHINPRSCSTGTSILQELLDEFLNEGGEWDMLRFNKVLSEIQSYSLIDFDRRNKTYSIHPLVHEWALSTTSNVHNTYSAQQLIACNVNWEFTSNDYSFRHTLQLHADEVLKTNEEMDNQVASDLALIYGEAGRWEEAEVLEVGAMEARKRVL